MIKSLQNQMMAELHNHNLYQTFANYAASKGLMLLCSYYRHRATEEYNHHNWIRDFIVECNTFSDYNTGVFPVINVESIEDTFIQTMEAEIKTTKSIEDLVDLANEECDYITLQWLLKSGGLLEEQREEEHVSKVILEMSKIETDWLTKQSEILNYYLNK